MLVPAGASWVGGCAGWESGETCGLETYEGRPCRKRGLGVSICQNTCIAEVRTWSFYLQVPVGRKVGRRESMGGGHRRDVRAAAGRDMRAGHWRHPEIVGVGKTKYNEFSGYANRIYVHCFY